MVTISAGKFGIRSQNPDASPDLQSQSSNFKPLEAILRRAELNNSHASGGCYERTIVRAESGAESGRMAKYSSLLGRRVDVQYRTGEVNLPASGRLMADSGRSIFLEERFETGGTAGSFRWEIPYQYIVGIAEIEASAPATDGVSGDDIPEVA